AARIAAEAKLLMVARPDAASVTLIASTRPRSSAASASSPSDRADSGGTISAVSTNSPAPIRFFNPLIIGSLPDRFGCSAVRGGGLASERLLVVVSSGAGSGRSRHDSNAARIVRIWGPVPSRTRAGLEAESSGRAGRGSGASSPRGEGDADRILHRPIADPHVDRVRPRIGSVGEQHAHPPRFEHDRGDLRDGRTRITVA